MREAGWAEDKMEGKHSDSKGLSQPHGKLWGWLEWPFRSVPNQGKGARPLCPYIGRSLVGVIPGEMA